MLLELLSLLICLYFFRDYLQTRQLEKKLGPIPMVSRIPVIGTSLKLLTFRPENLHLKFREFTARYGKTYAGRVFGFTMIVTCDERLIERLISSPQHTRKLRLYGLLSTWLGNGLLLSHGPHWQKMRKIITPTFHFKILERFVGVFDKQSRILVEKLGKFSDGRRVCNIIPLMGLATLDIIAETAMGVKIKAQDNEKSDFVQAVNNVTEILATRFMRPHLALPFLFQHLTPHLYGKLKSGTAVMHEFTEDIIKQRRMALQSEEESTKDKEGLKSHNPFLDVLLRATIDGQPLTDKQIRDEVNTFMFEGHDTTASATSFCLYLLSRHPSSQQKLFDEIHSHFGDNLNRPVTYHDLTNLNYLSCVVKESLRLYPPIPSIGRWLKDELKMDEITLSAGTNVTLLLWELLRSPEYFPQPETFLPERHLEENPLLSNSFVYIPFSAGLRNCIGQRFALLEMKTIIVNLIRNYELFKAGEDVRPSIKIVLKSSTGVNFGLRQRIYTTN